MSLQHNFYCIANLPDLPDLHNTYRLIDCTGLDQLPPMLPSVKWVVIENGTDLKSLSPLPPNLTYLKLTKCRDFTAEEYAAIPSTMTTLRITDMCVRDITALPQWITELDLYRTNTEELPVGVFPNLEKLDIYQVKNIHTICVPPKVTYTRLQCLPSLTKIVSFSPVGDDIRLTNLPKLTELPPFPPTLTKITLSRVPITMMPPFPNIHVKVHMTDTNLPLEMGVNAPEYYIDDITIIL